MTFKVKHLVVTKEDIRFYGTTDLSNVARLVAGYALFDRIGSRNTIIGVKVEGKDLGPNQAQTPMGETRMCEVAGKFCEIVFDTRVVKWIIYDYNTRAVIDSDTYRIALFERNDILTAHQM